QAILGRVWQEVPEIRNTLAHAGMREEEVNLAKPEEKARELLERCQDVLKAVAEPLPWPLPQQGRLVITPLGLKPGPLFTACRGLRPARLVIVTSRQAMGQIEETLRVAGMPKVEYRV